MEPRDIDIATLLAAASTLPSPAMFDCHFGSVNVASATTEVKSMTPAQLAAALRKMQQAATTAAAAGT